MSDADKIRAALERFDHDDDKLWTEAGIPSLDAVRSAVNDPGISRKDVSEAFPGFTRGSPEGRNVKSNNPALRGDAGTNEPGQAVAMADDQPRRIPTASELAEALPDAILLLEALSLVASTDRYRRNTALQATVRHYAVDQASVKEIQKRLDERAAAREAEKAAVAEGERKA